MNRASADLGLEQLHAILAKDWGQNEDRIRTTWTHFTDEERSRCYHSTGLFQGTMYYLPGNPMMNPDLTPEWAKIAESGAQYFLDMLELRATRSLYQQSFCPFKGFESDYSHVVQMISKGQANLEGQPRNSRMLFEGEKLDGAAVDIATHTTRLRELPQHGEHAVGVRALPVAVGDLVTWRQLRFLRSITYLACEVLEWDQKSSQLSKKAYARFEELMALSTRRSAQPGGVKQPLQTKILLPGLITRALSFIYVAEEANNLLESCPIHFFNSMSRFVRSEPGRAQDNKRQMTATTVGAAFFDCMSDKIKILCIWSYIIELLCLLHSTFHETASRHMALQQLSNATRLAYTHIHQLFRRELHIDMAKTTVKKFKGNRKNHPARGSRLHHLCCLAEQEAFANIASELFTKLMSSPPSFHDGINWRSEALGMLMKVILFIDELALALNMPSFPWPAEGQVISQFEHVDARMSQARPHADIKKLWLKMSVSKNISFAKSCRAKLDACTRKHVGDTLLGAYEEVVNCCLLELKSQLLKEKQNLQVVKPVTIDIKEAEISVSISEVEDKTDLTVACPKAAAKAPVSFNVELEEEVETAVCSTKTASTSIPIPKEEAKDDVNAACEAGLAIPSTSSSTEQKRKIPKAKAAPKGHPECHAPCTKEQFPPTPRAVQVHTPPTNNKITVSAATAQVFAKLFDKSMSHSGLHWASFEAAMAELDFRITPRRGSSVRFEPPASLGLGRSLTIHRPHGSRSEGFRALVLRQRLNRAFGWDEDTFVARWKARVVRGQAVSTS
ncbi:hypothetical protein ISF_00458 [Cordyceps fumosorosea ARSEF 2679]|uniref:Uncharacterized protein n=1 Tax=Cordyceps fumosorosea (strain ARSEF 2679) TaxID=1081104 RepID=A0A168E9Y6_CORFA|nr:hypothetical protein ISF_00458 [Cordyceps fumosorosea ARSEF 2679]OAA73557.1 hypothetical protein ISF_00458 [Cordyceps fumosorosea ARSEF 2679]